MIPGASPLVYLIPPLMGVAGYLALHNIWIWSGSRREPLHLWVSLWCTNSLIYLASHYVQATSVLPEHAVLGGRLAWTGAFVLILVTIGMSHALVGLDLPGRLMWIVGLVNVGLVLVLWLTGVFVSDQAYVRTDLLGFTYMAPLPGPLLVALVPYVLWVFVHAWRTIGRGELDEGERRALRAGFVAYVALALNDLLHSARLVQSIRVFDLGFVAVGVGLTYMLVRRHNRLSAHLQEEVAARTRDIEAGRAELAALVETGQAVMGGLDLEATLRRIVEQAGRITGSPHVKLLLLDREAGVLKMGALSGGTVPPDFQVPLGQSYSGTVAVTGQPLFVPDTQHDPRNLLAARDREQGIVTYLGLPVKKGDEVLGVLTINTETPHEYTAGELAYLGSFADQAAIAMDNARLYSAAGERGRRLEALASLTKGLAATRPLDDLLNEVVRSASELFAPSAARLWLMDEGGETISLRAGAGDVSEVTGATRLQVGQGMIGRITATGAPLVIEDLEKYTDRVNVERHRAEGLVSFAGVPLRSGDRRLGVLGIASRQRRRFGPEDMSLLQALADQAAMAIEGARLFAASRELAEETRALHDTGTALASTLELPAVLDSITASAIALTGAGGASVFELSPDDEMLRLRASRGIDQAATPGVVRLRQGAAGAAAARREPVWSADLLVRPLPGYEEEAPGRGKPLGELVGERGYRALLAVPLVSRDTVFGSICLYWYEPHEPGEREIRLLDAFARQAAVAVEHARLHAALGRRVDRLQTLTRISHTLSSSLDLGGVLKEIAGAAAELMEVPVASFWLIDENSRTSRLVGFSDAGLEADWTPRVLSFDQGVIGWVATHRRPLHVPDGVTTGRFVDAGWWKSHGLTSFYGIPVMHQESLVAVLALNGSQPFHLDAEDEALLSAFVSQAAVAIHNASLYEGAESRARQIQSLHRVGLALTSSLDLGAVLGAVGQSAMTLVEADGAMLYELDPRDGLVHCRSTHGIASPRPPYPVRPGQGASGVAVARRAPVWSADVRTRPLPGYEDEPPGAGRPLGALVMERPYRGILAVPVLSRDTVLGSIALCWRDVHEPTPAEIGLLEEFARQAAVALENARLYAAQAERLERLRTLGRINQVLSSSLERSRVLEEIARSAARLVQVPFASIWGADEARRTLTVGSVSDPEFLADWTTSELAFGRSGTGWVAEHRRSLEVADVFADGRFGDLQWWRTHGLQSYLGTPVLRDGAVVAVLVLCGRQPLRLGNDERVLLDAFVAQAAVAIHNASLYEAEGEARRAAELALAQVKQLHGMLPICAYCKKIRDDSNYWQTVETYIGQRSAATFSHGICPDCREKIVKPELERFRREQGGQR